MLYEGSPSNINYHYTAVNHICIPGLYTNTSKTAVLPKRQNNNNVCGCYGNKFESPTGFIADYEN